MYIISLIVYGFPSTLDNIIDTYYFLDSTPTNFPASRYYTIVRFLPSVWSIMLIN